MSSWRTWLVRNFWRMLLFWRLWIQRYQWGQSNLPCYNNNTLQTILSCPKLNLQQPRQSNYQDWMLKVQNLEVTKSLLVMLLAYISATKVYWKQIRGLSVPPSPAPMSRSSSLNPSTRDKEHHVRRMMSKGLERASCTSLSDDEAATLKDMINKSPDAALEILEPDILSFSGTIEFNPGLFRESILPLLLSSPLREE